MLILYYIKVTKFAFVFENIGAQLCFCEEHGPKNEIEIIINFIIYLFKKNSITLNKKLLQILLVHSFVE